MQGEMIRRMILLLHVQVNPAFLPACCYAYHYAVHIEHDTFAGESLPGGSDRGRHPPALPPPPPHLRPSLLRPPHNTHHQGEVKIIWQKHLLFPA